jgi:hypothetical protein
MPPVECTEFEELCSLLGEIVSSALLSPVKSITTLGGAVDEPGSELACGLVAMCGG